MTSLTTALRFPNGSGSILNQSTSPLRSTPSLKRMQSLKEDQEAFDIQTLEWFIESNKSSASQLKSYEILWVKKGSGKLTVDLNDIAIAANKVYVLRPGQFRHLSPGAVMEGYYMSLSSAFFHIACCDVGIPFLPTSYKGFGGTIVIQTDEDTAQETADILVKLSREFMHYAAPRTGIVKGLFKMFMLYLSQETVTSCNTPVYCAEKELVNHFTQALKNNFTTKKMVSDYASELCVTPGHLNRIVKKISGFPASHHIQQQIILEAKKQATYSNLSMKEIAYSLGFDDTAHFSKFFKNNSGMNFSNYKKMAY